MPVRPILRCLREDLQLPVPAAVIPLDEIDHIILRKAARNYADPGRAGALSVGNGWGTLTTQVPSESGPLAQMYQAYAPCGALESRYRTSSGLRVN